MTSTPGSVASPSDLHAEITEKIVEDGINADCSVDEKLFYIWRLFQQTEVDLQQSAENEERLRKTQAEEMHEVESYVEHIRHLSDERELLIQELETENDQLKLDNREMKKTVTTLHETTSGASEELIRQGLEDMSSASLSEQVAFLLVERARMIQEDKVDDADGVKVMLDNVGPNNSGDHVDHRTPHDNGSHSNHEQTINDTLREEREVMRQQEEKLKENHEEEINLLMDESDKLEEQLKLVKNQNDKLEKDICRLETELEKERKTKDNKEIGPRPASPARTNTDITLRKIIADKTQIECELVAMKSRVKQIEADNEQLNTTIKSLEQDLDVTKTQKLSLESKYMKAQTQLQDLEQFQILEATCEELKAEICDLEEKSKSDKILSTKSMKEQQSKLETLQNDYETIQGERSELMEMLLTMRNEKDAQLRLMEDEFKQDLLTKETNFDEEKKIYGGKMRDLEERLELLNGAKDQADLDKSKLELLFKDSQKLMERLKACQKDLEVSEARENQLKAGQAELETTLDLTVSRHTEEMESLKAKLEMSLQEFGKLLASFDQEKSKNTDLEVKLKEAEDQIVCENQDLEAERANYLKKIKALESRIEEMQDDMFLNQEELENNHERYETTVAQFTEEKLDMETEFMEKIDALESEKENLEKTLNKYTDERLEGDNLFKQKLNELKSKENVIKTLTDELNSLKNDFKAQKSKLKTEQDKNQKLENNAVKLQKKQTESQSDIKNSYETKLRDLQTKITSLEKVSDEKSKVLNRQEKERQTLEKSLSKNMTNLEEKCAKTAKENKDLHSQVNQLKSQCKTQEDQLQKTVKEKQGRLSSTQDELQKSKQEVTSSQDRMKQLREELQMANQNITALKMDAISKDANHEGACHKLQLENNELRLQHTKDIAVLSDKIVMGDKEIKRLQNLADDTQSKLELKHSVSDEAQNRVKLLENQVKHLENEVTSERNIREELQGRNGTLDGEIRQVWSQVTTLNDKITNLENCKKSLEIELAKIIVPLNQSENLFHTHGVTDFEMRTWKSRCEVAEAKVARLELELGETIVKMQTTERRYYDSTDGGCYGNNDAHPIRDVLAQKNKWEHTVNELQQHVAILKSREAQLCQQSHELQHRMIDMDGQMTLMRDRSQLAIEISHKAETNRRRMSEKIVGLQRDLKCMQTELQSSNQKRDIWEKRYDDRRMRMKSKLTRAREYYTDERKKLRDQVLILGEDLRITRTSLSLEQQWKDKMDAMYRGLMEEKRLLLTQIAEQGESSRDQKRQITILDSRTKFLEKENSQLQESLNSFHQKRPIINRAFSLDHKPHWTRSHDSVTMTTSGLGNSMDSSWDQDRLSDAMTTPTNVSPIEMSRFRGDIEISESERSFEV